MEEKFAELNQTLRGEVLERSEEIGTAVNAIVSRTHHFQLGPPGIAKSLLVERLNLYISGSRYFRWLLTKHTTPEEVFGPPDLGALRHDNVYRRIVEGKLPWAHFVFADECFKGSSAILNSFLTAMNERLFFNPGDDPEIPLSTMFGASNELPESDELNALWDRLHFRHEVKPLQASTSIQKMLTTKIDPHPDPILTIEDLFAAQAAAHEVTVPDDIIEGLLGLKGQLAAEGIEPTDRRWNESLRIIKAQAFLNGRATADTEDVGPLAHVLWSRMEEKKQVAKIIFSFASPYEVKAMDILSDLDDLREQVMELEHQDMEIKAADKASELYAKHEKIANRLVALRKEIRKAKKTSDYMDDAFDLFKSNVKILLHHLGIDDDEIMGGIDKALED